MPLILGANSVRGAAVHQIDQSIRFNDDDSPALNKTYSGAGSRVKFTFSCWLKVATTDTGSGFPLFNGGTGTSDTTWSGIAYYQGMIYAQGYSTNWRITTRKLRDPASWYNVVYVWDTGQVADTERIKIFINGVRETEFSTFNHPAKDAQSGIGQASQQHTIGYQSRTVGWGYADAYLAEMVYIDGQALDPSSFGETNDSGIWIPKDVSGLTFGTNGFHIDGRDSADLGDDESGNGNDYTSTGLAAHDQVSDSPTNSFCVLNPLDKGSNTTLANGNLEFTSSNDGGVRSSVFFNADKYYIEAIVGTYGNAFTFGIANSDRSLSADAGTDLADFYGWYINPTQNWIASGSNPWNTGSSSASASKDVMQIAIDASDASSIKLFAGINNTYYNSSGGTDGNPSTGANPTATITGGEEWSIGFWNRDAAASNILVNFGQEGTFAGNKTAGGNSDANGIGNFFHSVPTGFKAICTKNLGS